MMMVDLILFNFVFVEIVGDDDHYHHDDNNLFPTTMKLVNDADDDLCDEHTLELLHNKDETLLIRI